MLTRVPGISEHLADQIVRIVRSIRSLELKKHPSVSETLDWARTLVLLGIESIDAEQAKETLHILLKYQSDIDQGRPRSSAARQPSERSDRRQQRRAVPTDRRPGRRGHAGGGMLDILAGFIQELRAAGLPVSLTENLDAMEAVRHIPLEDREAFKYALAATLVKNNAHWKAFETIFEVYFSLRGRHFNIDGEEAEGDEADLERLLSELMGERADGPGRRHGGPDPRSSWPRCCTRPSWTATRRCCGPWPARR